MATESGVILPADSSGKALRTETVSTSFVTGAGGVVHQQVVSLGDPTTPANLVAVNATGELAITALDTVTTGNLTAVGSVTVSTAGGNGIVGIQVTGTWVATLVLEASTDGTNFFAVNGVASVSGAQVSTMAANGQWRVNSGGYQLVRVRASAFTSGTATVTLVASSASTMATLAEPLPAGTNNIGTVMQVPSALAVTATAGGTTGAVATVTLPVVAGQFHYITNLQIVRYAAAALTGSATPITVTTTNLPGNPAFTFQTAGAIGTSENQIYNFAGNPLRSAVAGTATTIVGPSTTNVLWRILVTYYTAA